MNEWILIIILAIMGSFGIGLLRTWYGMKPDWTVKSLIVAVITSVFDGLMGWLILSRLLGNPWNN